MRATLGATLFAETHWFVGKKEGPLYKSAGACHTQESGSIPDTLRTALQLARRKKRPLAFFADDISGIYKVSGDLQRWHREFGRVVSVSHAAKEILKHMRQVGAPVGGVYPCNDARCQLQMPSASYHHYFCMDFVVFDYPCVEIDINPEASPKEDYHMCATVLTAVGVTCRLNHLCARAAHYRAGGAGSREERAARDEMAARWLLSHWNKADSVVFQPSHHRGPQHITWTNGLSLVKRCHPKLVDAHKRLAQALGCQKLHRARISKLLAMMRRRRAAQERRAAKKALTRVEQQRRRRGAAAFGTSRRAGGRPTACLSGKGLANKDRVAITRARARLKALVESL